MAPMCQVFAAVALGLLSGQTVVAAPLLHAHDLAIDLGYGIYQGAHNPTTQLNVWKGIRYAAPPTGEQRWRAPTTPAVFRNNIVNTTAFAPGCTQAYPAPYPNAPSPSSSEDQAGL